MKSQIRVIKKKCAQGRSGNIFPWHIYPSFPTVIGAMMSHRKWREIKQQLIWWPDLALLGWCLVSLHCQCDILAPITVHSIGPPPNSRKHAKAKSVGHAITPTPLNTMEFFAPYELQLALFADSLYHIGNGQMIAGGYNTGRSNWILLRK